MAPTSSQLALMLRPAHSNFSYPGGLFMRTKYFLALTIAVLMGGGMLLFANPPAGSGSISGKITYSGTPPKMKPIDMSKEQTCAKQHTTPVLTENVATG